MSPSYIEWVTRSTKVAQSDRRVWLNRYVPLFASDIRRLSCRDVEYFGDPMGWSFSIGSISGIRIRIRIHLTLVLFLIWLGASFWSEGGIAAASNGLAYILLLFLCVVLHEFGHILTARRFGSQTLDVILLPIGGVARMKSIPEKPGQELAVALAGPCVILVIAAVLINLSQLRTKEVT